MPTSRRDFIAQTAAFTVASSLLSRSSSAQEAKKYKACIITDHKNGGYGHDLHLAFAHRKDVQVVALAEPFDKAQAKWGKEVGAERTYADWREMLEKEKPDLVSVGPRLTVGHKDYLLACAEIGAHGYMEKPLAVDLAEADEMVAAVEAKNLKWAIAHQKRMTPHVQHAHKKIVEEGLIGDILELRSRGKEDGRAGGEDLLVLGTHVFDLMVFFMGKAQWVSADITVDGRPATAADVKEASEPLGPVAGDRIQATYAFDKGIKGYFSSMKNSDGGGGRWGVDIYGSKGIVKMRINEEPIIHVCMGSSWAPGDEGAKWEWLPDAPAAFDKESKLSQVMNAFAVDDLIASIEEDREPAVSVQKARDTMEMIVAPYESHMAGGCPVKLPLAERTHPLKRWA